MDNSLQQISIEQLNSISFGDNEFKKELIEIFLEQIPLFISNITKFWAENDLQKLAKEAHTAKSSVLIFGMTNTGNTLKEIEIQSGSNVIEQLQSLIDSVVTELNAAKKELQIILSQI